MAWKTDGEDRLTYSFDYDDYKNLKAANSSDHKYTTAYTYNKNGNMETLERKDSLGLFQNFTYKYKGNQLDSLQRHNTEQVEVWPGDTNNDAKVDVDDLLDVGYNWHMKVRPRDKRSDAWMAWWVKRRKGDKTVFSDSNGDGFINEQDTVAIKDNLLKTHPIAKINKNNTYGYKYDANGNMTDDEYKNIEIHYNHLNLPDTITAHGLGEIINVYLADGSLLQRKVIVLKEDEEGNVVEEEKDRLDYQGEFLFQEDKLLKIITEEGYVSPSKSNKKKLTYYYVVSDHLGHSRVVLDEKENVIQTTAYYPYGLPITDLSSETKYKYLYTGKEFIGEFGLNWYDHHARQYDAEIGRWSAIDPQLVSASPYMAMGNNPMMMIDPDGENPLVAAVIIGAIIAGGSYTASVAFSDGGFSNWNWGQFAGNVGVGALAGALSTVGGGSLAFADDLILGMAEGAVIGGLSAAVNGGDIADGMMWGAASAAVLTTATSENMSNLLKKGKFVNNDNMFNQMMANGVGKQDVLDYFGFEGKYVPNKFDNDAWFGNKTGIGYSDGAFTSYHDLKASYTKEAFEKKSYFNGTRAKLDKPTGMFRLDIQPQEFKGHMHIYKNQGLYSNVTTDLVKPIRSIQSFMKTQNILSGELIYNMSQYEFKRKWWHFVYEIPRRF